MPWIWQTCWFHKIRCARLYWIWAREIAISSPLVVTEVREVIGPRLLCRRSSTNQSFSYKLANAESENSRTKMVYRCGK